MTVTELATFAAPYPSLAELVTRLARSAPRGNDPLVRVLLALTRVLG